MTTFLTGARETVAPRRGGRDGLIPPLLVALVILAAVAIIAVAWAGNPRTTAT